MPVKRVFYGLVASLIVGGILELFTGLILLPSYQPTVSGAYNSVRAIEANPALHFLQSFHHWMSAALMVIGAATLLLGIYWSAHRHSSKKIWIASLLLVLLFGFLQLTGHLLPWDQHAVSTAVVETGIAAGAPVVGNAQANLLRGGAQVGPATLNLWYWSHIAVLSVVWLVIGLYAFRKMRDGLSRKVLLGGLIFQVFAALILALFLQVHVGAAATPTDYQNFAAKPEWYVLPLHSLLSLFQSISPSVAFVGTMVIPALTVIVIALLPWLDRAGRFKKNWLGPALAIALLIGGVGLGAYSFSQVGSPNGPNLFSTSTAGTTNTKIQLDPALIAAGQKLFAQQGCDGCHTVNGKGGDTGPVLNGAGTRHPDLIWQISHLKNPTSESPGSTMPPYNSLSQDQLKSLAEYVESLK